MKFLREMALRLCLMFISLAATAMVAGQQPQTQPEMNSSCVNQDGKVLLVGNGVTAPRAIFRKEPDSHVPAETSSKEKKGKKFDGTTVLEAVVGADGKVCEAKVTRSLGKEVDQKSLDLIRQWIFEPARKGGKPVAVRISVEITYHLY